MKRYDYFKFLVIILMLIFMTGCGASTITTPSEPVINSFTASPLAITAGGSSTLAWEVFDATSVSIDHEVGSSLALSSTASISPTVTTTYTLTATNAAGTVTAPVKVTVSTTTYAVTFDSQGGSAVSTQTVAAGGLVTEPTAPTKSGYTFDGWYKESGCTSAWNFATDTVTSDITLYAKWATANSTYTLTMVVNPTGRGTTNPAVGVHPGYAANQVVSITAIPATDRNFINWSGAVTGSGNPTTVTMNANKTVTANFELAVGDSYGGGIVAYIFKDNGNGSDDPGYVVGETHGLIAAAADAPDQMMWSNITNTLIGTTGRAIGDGQANTAAIVGQTGCTSGAAYYCDNIEGVYSDWFLPSKDELYKLYINRVAIGGFADNYSSYYWSSSEFNEIGAWYGNFRDGSFTNPSGKDHPFHVRAVRDF